MKPPEKLGGHLHSERLRKYVIDKNQMSLEDKKTILMY